MFHPLTARQREILDFLRDEIAAKGRAPSLTEIGEHFHLSAIATVHKHMVNLEDKGYIRRQWNRARAVELLHRDGTCQYCGQSMPRDVLDLGAAK